MSVEVIKERVDRHRAEIDEIKLALKHLTQDVKTMREELGESIRNTNYSIQKAAWIAAGLVVGVSIVGNETFKILIDLLIK